MMSTARYWRPQSVEEALSLLERDGAAVLAGGTKLNARPRAHDAEVVDLQALGLDSIERRGDGTLVVGAMTRLQQLADHDEVPPVVRGAARREAPSTLRAQATLGGCVAAAEYDSELLATLLAYDARIEVTRREGDRGVTLEALLAGLPLGRGEIITAVSIDTRGRAELARTGRTPADRAIVAAVARELDGRRRLALAGVAATPVVVDLAAGDASPARQAEVATGRLTPPGDFRGSSEYRSALAAVLSTRVLEAVRQ